MEKSGQNQLFRSRLFILGQAPRDSQSNENGNVFNPFDFVYKKNGHMQYKQQMINVYEGSKDIENDAEALEKYFLRYWRRNQISDHYPIWFELHTDSSYKFLESKHAQLNQDQDAAID